MRNFLFAAVLATSTLIGVGASSDARADVTFSVQTPDLVFAAPGVQVVADYDDPVFFSDGFYWRYDDGVWYRSSVYYGGWEYWESPPVYVRNISRPTAFVHYRPSGYRPHFRPVAPHRTEHFVVRPRPVHVNVHENVRVQAPRVNVHENIRVQPRAQVQVHENVRVQPRAQVQVHENVHVQAPHVQAPPAHVEVHGAVHAGGHVEPHRH